jgi:3',5'-cyclic AMP phosphodiesterase CpdA
MKKLTLLFLLLIVVFAILLSLTLRQPATPLSASEIVRYSPSAIPAQPVDRADRFDFIVYGDTRNGHATHRTLIDHMLALNPDLVLSTGDLVSQGRRNHEWDTFLEIIKPLAQKVPYYTIRGNHDKGRNNYEKRFAPPNNSGTDRYYSFDYKSVHFIGLDTNQRGLNASKQRDWLVQDLVATDKPHIIAFFHHPPFGVTKGRGDNERIKKAFHDLFVKHGVNLVTVGHNHLYYRTQRNGVTYITTGGGGAPLHNVDGELPRLPDDVWGLYHHLVHITVTGELMKGAVIDTEGKIRDSFTVITRRHVRGKTTKQDAERANNG